MPVTFSEFPSAKPRKRAMKAVPPEPSKNDESVSVASTEALAVTVNTVVIVAPTAMPFDGGPPPSQDALVDAPKSEIPYGLPEAFTKRFHPALTRTTRA